jgi:hypothetical protein
MILKREEGGKIVPFENSVTDGSNVVNPRSEGFNAIYTTEGILLAEIMRGLEYLSQQIYEMEKGKK